ncbi:MAG: hypothetical protein GEU82_01365 [Luteitalea sp.]|nr:hypothetical protein [Luteitalea sp.]
MVRPLCLDCDRHVARNARLIVELRHVAQRHHVALAHRTETFATCEDAACRATVAVLQQGKISVPDAPDKA